MDWLRSPAGGTARELAILLSCCAMLLFYGLVPLSIGPYHVSRAEMGLVGADEPRYAQIAREMMQEHATVCRQLGATAIPHSLSGEAISKSFHCAIAGGITPILYGHPWLEKPALYYWRTMSFFKEFGTSDWVARLPSSTGALAMVILIYLHMRRFRPGGHLDAALITASCTAVVAFARGASTDMQLAAPFAIGMLGWYAWYETGKKFWLFDLYFFGALAVLAKGPVAVFLGASIILLFVGLRREWSVLRRMVWVPGLCLFAAMVLPWYIAVQKKNPTFIHFFLLEQNLQRFASNRYLHHQKPYYYLLVLVLALMPWTIIGIRALVDSVEIAIAEWKVRHNPSRYLGHTRAGDAFPEFLVLWALFPIVFFSFSGSKLPGYILPAIPPITILTGDYIYRIRRQGLSTWLLVSHGVAAGVFAFVLLLCPQYMVYEKIVPSKTALLTAASLGALFALMIIFFVRRFGLMRLRFATLTPVVFLLFFILRVNGWILDANYSARPLAARIAQLAPNVKTLATYHIRRDTDYGLCFYRNQPLRHYTHEDSQTEKMSVIDGIPQEEHIVVVRADDTASLAKLLPNRIYQPLLMFTPQALAVYRVAAAPPPPPPPPASSRTLPKRRRHPVP